MKRRFINLRSGKYPDYNFYHKTGMAVAGKAKGEADNEAGRLM